MEKQFFAVSVDTKSAIDSYKTRIEADSGTLENYSLASRIYQGLNSLGLTASLRVLWTGEMGTKERVSGINHYATKLYSIHQNIYFAQNYNMQN